MIAEQKLAEVFDGEIWGLTQTIVLLAFVPSLSINMKLAYRPSPL